MTKLEKELFAVRQKCRRERQEIGAYLEGIFKGYTVLRLVSSRLSKTGFAAATARIFGAIEEMTARQSRLDELKAQAFKLAKLVADEAVAAGTLPCGVIARRNDQDGRTVFASFGWQDWD